MPDLSRYQNQQQTPYSNGARDPHSSTMAAASALRTHSLNTQSFNPQIAPLYVNPSQGRTMSMSSYRANSLSSLHGTGRPRSVMSTQSAGRPEKIVIKRTETKDQYGRTTSITTETIRTLGSFDLVKTEKKDLFQPPMANFHGSSALDNELGSILEEEDEDDTGAVGRKGRTLQKGSTPPIKSRSPVKSILKNGEKRMSSRERKVVVVGDDEEVSDGGSVYSDANDMLPAPLKQRQKPRTKFAADVEDNLSSSKKQPGQVPPQKQLSEKEMYDMAYKVALEKVYGGKQDLPQPSKTNGFRSYSLRSDNSPSLRKKSSSSRISLSRSNSITSLSQRFISGGSKLPKEIPTTETQTESVVHDFRGFDSSNVGDYSSPVEDHQLDSHSLASAHQYRQLQQLGPPPQIQNQSMNGRGSDTSQEKKKKSSVLSRVFGGGGSNHTSHRDNQSILSQATHQSQTTSNSVIVTGPSNIETLSPSPAAEMPQSFAEVMNFESPEAHRVDENTDASTLMQDSGDDLRNGVKGTTPRTRAADGKGKKQKKKFSFKNLITLKF